MSLLKMLETSLSPTPLSPTVCLGPDHLLSLQLGAEHLPRWMWQGRTPPEEISTGLGSGVFNASLQFVI